MANTEKYPDPEDLEFEKPSRISPDQAYHLGWAAQHARLWLFVLVNVAVNIALLAVIFITVATFKPTIQYVTFPGGFPVIWNEKNEAVIADKVYSPARLRAVVDGYMQSRFGYDWQQPEKVRDALRYMSKAAQDAELQKLSSTKVLQQVVAGAYRYVLQIDYSKMKVTVRPDNTFEISIEGIANVNDNFRYPDPAHPFPKNFTTTLVIKSVEATDVNPFGYEIVETGPDIFS